MEAVESFCLPKCGNAQFKPTSPFSGCCPAAFPDQSSDSAQVNLSSPARQGSQPRQPTVDNQILNLCCRGNSHFQQVKIQLMQTHVFVRFRFCIHTNSPVIGVRKQFIPHHTNLLALKHISVLPQPQCRVWG